MYHAYSATFTLPLWPRTVLVSVILRLVMADVPSHRPYLPCHFPVSRSGLDKSVPKKGAGVGNWGSVSQETERYIHNPDLMNQLDEDERALTADDREMEEMDRYQDEMQDINGLVEELPSKPKDHQTAVKPAQQRRTSSMSDEERDAAAAFRKGAMGRQGGEPSSFRAVGQT